MISINRKRVICSIAFFIMTVGVTSAVYAGRDYFTFVNGTQYTIKVDFLAGIFCTDHHSGPIYPGGTWECNTKCKIFSKYKVYADVFGDGVFYNVIEKKAEYNCIKIKVEDGRKYWSAIPCVLDR